MGSLKNDKDPLEYTLKYVLTLQCIPWEALGLPKFLLLSRADARKHYHSLPQQFLYMLRWNANCILASGSLCYVNKLWAMVPNYAYAYFELYYFPPWTCQCGVESNYFVAFHKNWELKWRNLQVNGMWNSWVDIRLSGPLVNNLLTQKKNPK